MKRPDNQLLVIFGASGDLTGRKLLPALYELYIRHLLPERFCILGASRTPYTDNAYRTVQKEKLRVALNIDKRTEDSIESFLHIVHYLTFDPTQSSEYRLLSVRIAELLSINQIPDKVIFYMATPPLMYKQIPTKLQEYGLNAPLNSDGWRRIIVEKPFGTNLESALDLNKHLCQIFQENEIYRIDHYLGKETVQNILVLRFANGIFEPLWNRNYIDSIEIYATETLGVENRGKYYDSAGALRDMIQNHLIQLMGFMAMEAPAIFESEAIRDEIAKVFRSIRPYNAESINKQIIRAQYEGYTNEPDVSENSYTETYVAMKIFIDNWRWSGVPFYISTGKKLADKRSEIIVNFKSTPHLLFAGQCSGSSCNKLIIRIQPDESITLQFGLKEPGAGFSVKQVGMNFRYNSLNENRLPDAYERLLIDAMHGDSTLFARNDSLQISWSFIDPILRIWQRMGKNHLYFYTPGGKGPQEKDILEMQSSACTC